jgi:hypothetical protein
VKGTRKYSSFRHRDQVRAKNIKLAIAAGIPIVSRDDAVLAGGVRYFSGDLCPQEHISERYVKSNVCVECAITKRIELQRKDPKKHSQASARYVKQRRESDADYAFLIRARALITNSVRRMGYRVGGKTESVLGCSWAEFKKHIEQQFVAGMSWESHGEWHIDHITPISSAKSRDEVMALSHYTNLRPLWADDNRKKANKITHLI